MYVLAAVLVFDACPAETRAIYNLLLELRNK